MRESKNGAIYLRLSRDDRRQNESESIANQRLLLVQYALYHGISIAYEFSDDGVTGTTQKRKGLQNLYRAIEDGFIDTVLVKDLSRLSRNYIHTGELIEEWFPAHGVRLISVDDGVDTGAQSPSNDIFAIRAVMDDWYARDISRKVRAAIYARQTAGFCTSASLPLGYQKTEKGIIVSETGAAVVRQIFNAYESGLSCCEIAKKLHQTPGAVCRSDTSIRRMLKNTAYIGKLHLHVTEKASYKSIRRITVPDGQNVILEIPRIISDDQFERVQQASVVRAKKHYPKHWLAGRVYCALCGAGMNVSGSEEDGRIICSSRKRFKSCQAPSVRQKDLLNTIYDIMQRDGIPVRESICRRAVFSVRIAPDCITVCMQYRKPVSKT